MSAKKRFSIAADLASGIRHTIQSASTHEGHTLHYDMMSLDMLEPDPHNPRQLSISRDEMIHGIFDAEGADYQKKMAEWEALNELAESIKKVGIKQAIEVYKDGNKYRIITGERRYWAAFLSRQQSVPVRVSQKPDAFHLRYTQWVENINRQDLSLWEKLNNLLLMSDAYGQTNQEALTEKTLQSLLGVSSVQAYRYFHLIHADESIVQLIRLGKLNNLKLVQELVSMKDKVAQRQIITWILSSKSEVTSLAHYKKASGIKRRPPKPGKNAIHLGKVSHPGIAKELFNLLLSTPTFQSHQKTFGNIDWSSPKDIHKAFKKLIQLIEHEYGTEEMA